MRQNLEVGMPCWYFVEDIVSQGIIKKIDDYDKDTLIQKLYIEDDKSHETVVLDENNVFATPQAALKVAKTYVGYGHMFLSFWENVVKELEAAC